ncbi:MAG: MerC domain-containing protein [Sphingomonadales bacterium]|nr:MerC domain-containing protein [Sphingomonadales bacterium]MDE2171892.1 MerC domain-containing protein [Sphingomonadales bacterium]
MSNPILLIRDRLDRMGVLLSALCAVHCVSGVVLVAFLGISGGALLDPRIHEFGLVAAVMIGALGLGSGALRHGRRGPLMLGGAGLTLMACGLLVHHGMAEVALTVAGVTLLAAAHIGNLRHAH